MGMTPLLGEQCMVISQVRLRGCVSTMWTLFDLAHHMPRELVSQYKVSA